MYENSFSKQTESKWNNNRFIHTSPNNKKKSQLKLEEQRIKSWNNKKKNLEIVDNLRWSPNKRKESGKKVKNKSLISMRP